MNRKIRLNYVLFFFLQSCIITQNSDDYLLKPKELIDPIDQKQTSEAAKQPYSEIEHLSKPKMLELVKQLTEKDASLKKEDEAIIHSIPTPVEENSLLEALLVLGVLHEAAREGVAQKDQLKEKDLTFSASTVTSEETTQDENKKQSVVFKSQRSLSSIFDERAVDLLKTLENNPFLSGVSVALLALKASEQTSNTIEFDGKIKEIYTSRSKDFEEVETESKTASVSLAKESESPAITDQKKEENKQTENPENKETFSIEHLFLKAEEMIEDEKFKEAIGFLEQVPKNHPSFEKAQNKIKETANLAVQKLRQKAAKSFQAANPVSDIKARRAYLLEAKKYLDEALTNYQNSEKLETVKQNLEVINRQLQNLSDGTR